MQSYSREFSVIYNKLWIDYAMISANRILRFFQDTDIARKNRTVLDVCCGTGQLLNLFLEWGFYATGLDSSEAMLNIAKLNNSEYMEKGKVEFLQEDAAHFSSENKFGLVTCVFDSVNHLENLNEVYSFLQSAYSVLDNDGFLIFDFNTEMGLKLMWKGTSLVHEDEESIVFTHSWFDETDQKAYTKVIGFNATEKLWNKFEEIIFNTIIKSEWLEDSLKEIGFKDIYYAVMKDLSIPVQNPEQVKRPFVICRK